MDRERLVLSLEQAVELSFSRSSGSGGQNVNKVNTKVTARLDLGRLEGLTDDERSRLLVRLRPRLTEEGDLLIQAQDTRSQVRNRALALRRLELLLLAALRPPRKRISTHPTRASKERRLAQKRHLKNKKADRRSSRGSED